jgi:hypothetical protein
MAWAVTVGRIPIQQGGSDARGTSLASARRGSTNGATLDSAWVSDARGMAQASDSSHGTAVASVESRKGVLQSSGKAGSSGHRAGPGELNHCRVMPRPEA